MVQYWIWLLWKDNNSATDRVSSHHLEVVFVCLFVWFFCLACSVCNSNRFGGFCPHKWCRKKHFHFLGCYIPMDGLFLKHKERNYENFPQHERFINNQFWWSKCATTQGFQTFLGKVSPQGFVPVTLTKSVDPFSVLRTCCLQNLLHPCLTPNTLNKKINK